MLTKGSLSLQKLNLLRKRIEAFHQKQKKKQKVLVSLRGNSINLAGKSNLYDLCKRSDFSEQDVFKLNPDNTTEFTAVYYDEKYSGYVKKQKRNRKMKTLTIFL
ncbi:MAG: hypothetical protein CM15mP22_5730 [Gammaproteobacteria bacterium]|nr:MAG: hypothetical protein CM15mP22_5730 [Gammaproteobacteria bacterium]